MFDVEMDVSLTFDPPMDANSRGIHVTRRFKLPFAPQKGFALTGRVFSDHPDPEGFMLQNVVWDEDRRVFLVDSSASTLDFPIALIPDELRSWIERGWRLGSYRDNYEQDEEEDELESEAIEQVEFGSVDDDWDDLDKLPSTTPRRRPRDFNRLMKALIREMSELFNNQDIAYAMDQTDRYFTEDQLKGTDTAVTRKWREALETWKQMSMNEQIAWQRSVAGDPSIDKLI